MATPPRAQPGFDRNRKPVGVGPHRFADAGKVPDGPTPPTDTTASSMDEADGPHPWS